MSASAVDALAVFDSVPGLQLVRVLETLPLLPSDRRREALLRLPLLALSASEQLLRAHVLPAVFSLPMFVDEAAEPAMRAFLTPRNGDRGVLPEGLFQLHAVPFILSSFAVRDVQVRLRLLHMLEAYVESLSREQLRSAVLPEVLVGLDDAHDALRSASLCALCRLIPLVFEPASASAAPAPGSDLQRFSLETLLVKHLFPHFCDVLHCNSSAATEREDCALAVLRLWSLAYTPSVCSAAVARQRGRH